jgi:hypothetical protein
MAPLGSQANRVEESSEVAACVTVANSEARLSLLLTVLTDEELRKDSAE